MIFGAIIGTVVLKEGFGPRRITAATMVVVGIGLLAGSLSSVSSGPHPCPCLPPFAPV